MSGIYGEQEFNGTSVEEIVAEVREYVEVKHHGDYKDAFDAFSEVVKGRRVMGPTEITMFLRDVGVGNALTRRLYARAAVEHLDDDGDGLVTFEEFKAHLDEVLP